MKLTSVAKDEKGFIEKTVSLENLPNGNYELVSKTKPTSGKEAQEIRMEFTKQGYQALIGSWQVFEELEKRRAEV